MQLFTIGLKNLPFVPDSKQVIYIESSYDKKVNRLIRVNHKCICKLYANFGYEFCYLPLMHKKLNEEVRRYYYPGASFARRSSLGSDFLLNYMVRPENRIKIKPSLLFVNDNVQVSEGEDLCLRGVELGNVGWSDYRLNNALMAIIRDRTAPTTATTPSIRYRTKRKVDDIPPIEQPNVEGANEKSADDGVRYCIRTEDREDPFVDYYKLPDDFFKEYSFDDDTRELVREVAEKIDRLKQKGVSLYVLEEMLRSPIALSSMVITSDYRIILPEYKRMEIEMTPLVRAVYFLFLRHPEGIIFKHLSDYREELQSIYEAIKGAQLDAKMLKSVMDATDPFNNSINEKVARIREAFIANIDERIAREYIIVGGRGDPKRIPLHRELVEWQKP